MSDDRDRQVRIQFLEEAVEYLDTIEAGLLGLAAGSLTGAKMDEVLRAAHSIKGGAAMMGFTELSELAHRQEDFFKVLKAGNRKEAIDGNLEKLLLLTVDYLRQTVSQNRQEKTPSQDWLEQTVNPVFEQIHALLGDPQPEDAMAMLAADMGEDMSIMIFQTEVEESLQQLETLVAESEPATLSEQFSFMVQEMLGLGEMLEIPAFSSLCQSIIDLLDSQPEQITTIAQNALKEWRKSQALIMVGQVDILPTKLELNGSIETPTQLEESSQAAAIWDNDLDLNLLETEELTSEETEETQQDLDALSDALELEADELFSSIEGLQTEKLDNTPVIVEPESLKTVAPVQPEIKTPAPVAQSQEKPISEATATTKDNTIRVSIKNLEQIVDLFGEITIERNGIGLQVKSLRNLFGLLNQRIKNLEKANARLRTAYDKVATQNVFRPTVTLNASLASQSQNTNSSNNQNNLFKIAEDFDSLEMDSYSNLHLLSQEVMETIVQIQEVSKDIDISIEEAEKGVKELDRTTKQIQSNINLVRMRPVADLVERFPRALRNMELKYGKQVQLKVKGGATLVDRNVLDTLADPLMHLFRNAFDHGIEDPQTRLEQGKPPQGTITISASYRGNQTAIQIKDDGKGINLDKIRSKVLEMGLSTEELTKASKKDLLNLIFEPGFSTAEQVTDLSGRGVGMDVVKTNIKEINGDIQVDTTEGVGTTFMITVPFTLSVVRVLLVESNGMLLAFPSNSVAEMIPFDPQHVMTSTGQEVLNWDDVMIPLMRLSQWLPVTSSQATNTDDVPIINEPAILMIAQGNTLTGIQVDRYWREEEVTIRQVEGDINLPSIFTGCTILGDGKVIPLIDAVNLLDLMIDNGYQNQPESQLNSLLQSSPPLLQPKQKTTIMVVDDSITVRRFLAHTLEKANYRVEQAKDGQDALEKLQAGLSPQAIICDIEMPRLDGYGFLANARANPQHQKVPIIMLTSRSGTKHRQLAMNLGASAYFSKPFQEKQLLKTINDLISL